MTSGRILFLIRLNFGGLLVTRPTRAERNPLAVEMYSRKVIEQKLDYIHNNPVQGKWMLANSPIDYHFSSASFYELGDKKYSFLTHYMEDI
jgi:putative transposase